MERGSVTPTATPPAVALRAGKYRSDFGTAPSFNPDEGYSDDTKSLAENDGNDLPEDMLALPEWLLSHGELDRAELAYSLLRTLRTSTISAVVDRLTPLLHMDPVLKLPPEITAEIFFYLDPATLLTASLASRSWRSRILDSRLWRHLYIHEGWGFDMQAIQKFEDRAEQAWSRNRRSLGRHSNMEIKKRVPSARGASRRTSYADNMAHIGPERDPDHMDLGTTGSGALPDAEGDHEMFDSSHDDYAMRSPTARRQSFYTSDSPHPRQNRKQSFSSSSPGSLRSWNRLEETSNWIKPTMFTKSPTGIPRLNWAYLYKQRERLEDNWRRGRFVTFQLPHPLYPLEGHRECVYAIQFSGKWLVSASRDKTLRIWNLETRRLRGPPLVGHTKSVLCLQFDPSEDEDVIFSGSGDRNVIMWRFSTGEKIYELSGAHQGPVLNLRFDRRFLVTCSKDKLIKVWNREELRPGDRNYPKIYKGVGVRYPSYIVDTSVVPSAVLESQIANQQIKTLPPYSLLMTLDGHGAAVNAIQIGENEIVSASGDRLIKVWNIYNGKCEKTLPGHSKGIACVQLDGRRIISGSNDNTLRIYDHASGAQVACLQGHQDLVRTVQAGFGDLPGADETLKLEAMAVDHDYWEAHDRGDVDYTSPGDRRGSSAVPSVGSRQPKDVTTIGARIPPGGGGSKWARIVSGSYDESIIIWRRDNEGKWVVGQKLRQEDAANAASTTPVSPVAGSSSRNPDQAQAALEAQLTGSWGPHPNGPSHHQAAGLQHGLQNPAVTASLGAATGSQAPVSQNQGNAAGPSQQIQQGNAVTQPVVIPQPQTTNDPAAGAPGNANPTALGAANLPLGPNVHPAYRAFPHPGHPTARVYKLQFDARKLICASQDYRIVGWDFACGDEEIEEACRFFKGF